MILTGTGMMKSARFYEFWMMRTRGQALTACKPNEIHSDEKEPHFGRLALAFFSKQSAEKLVLVRFLGANRLLRAPCTCEAGCAEPPARELRELDHLR